METNKQYLGLVLKPQRPKAKGVGILQSRPGFILQLSRSGFENLTKISCACRTDLKNIILSILGHTFYKY